MRLKFFFNFLRRMQRIETEIEEIKAELKSIKNERKEEQYSYQPFGKDSSLVLFDDTGENSISNADIIPGLAITLTGKNSHIRIHKSADFRNSNISITSDNVTVEIFGNTVFYNSLVRCEYGNSQKFSFGKNSITYGSHFMMDDDSQIYIGEGCLFSNDTEFWAADGHSVIDASDNSLLNRGPYKIQIGNHCWIGLRSIITKNSILGNNNIVGAGTIISGKYEDTNTAIVGPKAKVVRSNISWKHTPPLYYKKN